MPSTASTSSVVVANASTSKSGASSNWKALRKTMPVSVAAQEMGATSKKRKREANKETFDPAQFVRGQSIPTTQVDTKGKGKGKAKEVLLGEEGVTGARAEPGQYISLDCEFVGLYDPANNHGEHSLARVSIVNYHGAVVLDTFVAQRERVGDWRTWVSGVRAEDVKNAPTYEEVQKQVADILKGRVLVGHAVHNDLKVLLLSHPRAQTRDTSSYGPLRELAGTKRPSLKNLAKKAVGIDIQEGEHSSVTDARATMAIYRSVQKDWEATLKGASRKTKKLKVAKENDGGGRGGSEASEKPAGVHRKNGGPAVKGGPAPRGRGSLGLAATLAKEKDWWSSGTLD